jgi:serine/threonine protein kinase
MECAHPDSHRTQNFAHSEYSPSRPKGPSLLIQSANIFLTKTGDAKLGDLNVSKVAKNGLLYTQTGTPYYASPEVWKD